MAVTEDPIDQHVGRRIDADQHRVDQLPAHQIAACYRHVALLAQAVLGQYLVESHAIELAAKAAERRVGADLLRDDIVGDAEAESVGGVVDHQARVVRTTFGVRTVRNEIRVRE